MIRHVAQLTVFVLLLAVLTSATAQMRERKPASEGEKKVFAADFGPSTVDVSVFPAEYQALYEVFAKRCSKCHTLARPINSRYKGAQWRRYVRRMMRKPDSGISPSTGKKILSFLNYYSEHKEETGYRWIPPETIDGETGRATGSSP